MPPFSQGETTSADSCLLLRMKMPYHFMVCYFRTEFASKGANSFKELRWGNENHSVVSPGSVLIR